MILAGISISMLAGDNSILQKTTDAKTYTERASVVEQAQTDVLGYQAENKGGDLEKSQLKTVLEKYFINSEIPDKLPSDLSTLELNTLSKYGTHKIKVSEIYTGNIRSNNVQTMISFSISDNFYRKWTMEFIMYCRDYLGRMGRIYSCRTYHYRW